MKYMYMSLGALYALMGMLWGYWAIIANEVDVHFMSLKMNLDSYYIGLVIVGLVLFLVSMGDQGGQEMKLRVLKLAVIINTLVIAVWSICCPDSILLLGCFGMVFFFVVYFLLYIGKCLLLLRKGA